MLMLPDNYAFVPHFSLLGFLLREHQNDFRKGTFSAQLTPCWSTSCKGLRKMFLMGLALPCDMLSSPPPAFVSSPSATICNWTGWSQCREIILKSRKVNKCRWTSSGKHFRGQFMMVYSTTVLQAADSLTDYLHLHILRWQSVKNCYKSNSSSLPPYTSE